MGAGWRGLALLALLALAGCIPNARITARGLELRREHYLVRARPDGSLAHGAWLVDNFRVVGGRPQEPLLTPDRTRRVAVDYDGDGRIDRTTVEPVADLQLVHERDGATMWAQTTPITRRLSTRDLDVIAHDFIDRVGSGSYVSVDWDAEVIRERRVATVIHAEGAVAVDGAPGYRVTFEIVSVDQRAVNPTQRGEFVTVVFVRPSTRWTESGHPSAWERGVPMLVTFGLASRAEHHEAHLPEFDELLGRVDFRDPESR